MGRNEIDTQKMKEGLIEYLKYRLDEIEKRIYDDSENLLKKIARFYREDVTPLIFRDYPTETSKIEDKIEKLEKELF